MTPVNASWQNGSFGLFFDLSCRKILCLICRRVLGQNSSQGRLGGLPRLGRVCRLETTSESILAVMPRLDLVVLKGVFL